MPPTLVDLSVIYSPEAEQYFARNGRRVMTGLRSTLNMLGIPLPDYAKFRKPGPTPAAAVLAAFRADHPERLSSTLAPRKPNASPEAIAAARARSPLHAGSAW